jgi:hypothetical protein
MPNGKSSKGKGKNHFVGSKKLREVAILRHILRLHYIETELKQTNCRATSLGAVTAIRLDLRPGQHSNWHVEGVLMMVL